MACLIGRCELLYLLARCLSVQDGDLVECPIDSSHRLPERALKTHGRYCRLKQSGYTKGEMVSLRRIKSLSKQIK